jgi:ATP-dependent helicase/nuclease subunit A
LCGRHDSAGETDEPTLTDLESAEPEDAGSWRDWVQPELFDDELLATLDTESTVRRSSGSGEYAVSLPKPPVSIESDSDVDPRLDRSPEPSEPASSVRISATEYADLVAERTDGTEVTVSGEEGAELSEPSATDTDRRRREEVSATAFGKAVHKICELRPPEDRWDDVARQMFAAEDAGEFDAETMDRIRDHSRYGIEFVDGLVEESIVEQQYDELLVRAELDDGEVFGYVDHLLVTPSCYHVVDYKTGSVENGVEEAAREYVEQLKAYAVALMADDPARDVSVSLVFTEPRKEWNRRFDSAEIASVRDEIRSVLRSVSADSS